SKRRSRATPGSWPSAAAPWPRATARGAMQSPGTSGSTSRCLERMSAPKLLIALHDVTPVHRERIERAERLLAQFGVPHVAYLLVPDYHGLARADRSASFVAWCRASRSFEVQWLLHGYFHDDRTRPTDATSYRPTIIERLGTRLATDGEAECIGLGPG